MIKLYLASALVALVSAQTITLPAAVPGLQIGTTQAITPAGTADGVNTFYAATSISGVPATVTLLASSGGAQIQAAGTQGATTASVEIDCAYTAGATSTISGATGAPGTCTLNLVGIVSGSTIGVIGPSSISAVFVPYTLNAQSQLAPARATGGASAASSNRPASSSGAAPASSSGSPAPASTSARSGGYALEVPMILAAGLVGLAAVAL